MSTSAQFLVMCRPASVVEGLICMEFEYGAAAAAMWSSIIPAPHPGLDSLERLPKQSSQSCKARNVVGKFDVFLK